MHTNNIKMLCTNKFEKSEQQQLEIQLKQAFCGNNSTTTVKDSSFGLHAYVEQKVKGILATIM